MKETQESISAWANETFGKPHMLATIVARLNEEMAELVSAVSTARIDDAKVLSECADVYIVLCQVANKLGRSLEAEVDFKMRINRARKWVTSRENPGVGQHKD